MTISKELITRLTEIIAKELSFVPRGANKQNFVIKKEDIKSLEDIIENTLNTQNTQNINNNIKKATKNEIVQMIMSILSQVRPEDTIYNKLLQLKNVMIQGNDQQPENNNDLQKSNSENILTNKNNPNNNGDNMDCKVSKQELIKGLNYFIESFDGSFSNEEIAKTQFSIKNNSLPKKEDPLKKENKILKKEVEDQKKQSLILEEKIKKLEEKVSDHNRSVNKSNVHNVDEISDSSSEKDNECFFGDLNTDDEENDW